MSIDGCRYMFSQLANDIFPRYMSKMKERMRDPLLLVELATTDASPAAVARKHGLDGDFPGCHVLLDDGRPIYVGISRKVLARLRNHILGQGHEDATLAYMMTKSRHPHKMTRAQAMRDPAYRADFAVRQQLSQMSASFVEIQNDLEMHLFEAHCAMELGTVEWSTFRTH